MPSYAPPLFTHFDSANGAVSLARAQPNKISMGKLNAHPAASKYHVGDVIQIQNDSGVAADLVFSGAGSYSTVSALAAGAFTSLTLTTDGLTTITLGSAVGSIYAHDAAVPPNMGAYKQASYAVPYNSEFSDGKTFENQD